MQKPKCKKCSREIWMVIRSVQYYPLERMTKNPENPENHRVEFGDCEEAFDEENWFECDSCGKLKAEEIDDG